MSMIEKIKTFWKNNLSSEVNFYSDRVIAPGYEILFGANAEYSIGPLLSVLMHTPPKWRRLYTVSYELSERFIRDMYEYNGINLLDERAKPSLQAFQRWVYPYTVSGFISLPDRLLLTLSGNHKIKIL